MTEQKPERCNWRDFITCGDDAPAEFTDALTGYFDQFCKPDSDCPGCGSKPFAHDPISAFLEATFEWGVVHGHGHCGKCGWPGVVHHFVKDEDGDELCTLRNFGLMVHPDFVERRAKARSHPQ